MHMGPCLTDLCAGQLGEYMLHPERLADLGRLVEQQHSGNQRLPRDAFGEGVQQRMTSQFDATQFGAIVVG